MNMNVNNLCKFENLDIDNFQVQKILKERYEAGNNYTYAGDIFISVLPSARTKDGCSENSHCYDSSISGLSNGIYDLLNISKTKQCCITSGESGSGKTRNHKLIIEHFLSCCIFKDFHLYRKVKCIDSILDGFIQAKTHSSICATRCIIYFEVIFDRMQHKVIGANTSHYMLERSRITSQQEEDENFNVFFYMFSGFTEVELSKLLLDAPSNHRYLKHGCAFSSDEMLYWSKQHNKLLESLSFLSLQKEEIFNIFVVLSAILNLGDIKFCLDNDEDTNESVYIENYDNLDKVALLLGIDSEDLEIQLTTNTSSLADDSISCYKSLSECVSSQDSLARSIYLHLVGWLVQRINQILSINDYRKRSGEFLSASFLDMFGFQGITNTPNNGLDELCINAANEQIQFHFTQNLFALEQNEFEEEELFYEKLSYNTNKEIINLLLEKPSGILAILDEESKCEQADEQTLLSVYNARCSDSQYFINTKSLQPTFTICHFAGKVTYSTEGFREQNQDKIEETFLECLRNSKNELVSNLFNASLTRTNGLIVRSQLPNTQFLNYTDYRSHFTERLAQRKENEKTYGSNKASHSSRSKKKKSVTTGRKIKPQLSVASVFRNSLVDLMGKILSCQPHFVRCIKANKSDDVTVFDDDYVLEQIEYFGILDTIKFRCHGYPVRLPYKTFIDRYRSLKYPYSRTLEENSDTCKDILKAYDIKNARSGISKIFLKLDHIERLNSELKKLIRQVTTAQKMVRGHLARIDFEFLQGNRKKEDRNLGSLLVSISAKTNKMYDNIIPTNDRDVQRIDKFKEKELKKKEIHDNSIQQQHKLTKTSSDPDAVKTKETLRGVAAENTPNRKVPKSKVRSEPLMRNFTSSATSAWCRVDCYERQYHIASFQMDQAVLCVEGTHVYSDKNRIAFSSLPSKTEDPKVAKVKSCIGKGVQLHQDERQNLWATRLGKNPIFVRGHTLCPELVKLNGKLTQGVPMKVLDTSAFKEYIRKECEVNGNLTQELKDKIVSRLKVCMSFIKDTVVDEETPCWFEIWLLKYKDYIIRYLDTYQRRRTEQEKRRSLHLAYTPTSDSPKPRQPVAPSIRRAKSGDQLKSERSSDRRPRSQTTLTLSHPTENNTSKIPRPRPPSQHMSQSPDPNKSGPNVEKAMNRIKQLQNQEYVPRRANYDFRREKSMDVRLESRVLLNREHRHSMGRSLEDKSSKRNKTDSPSPEVTLSRTASGGRKKEVRDSVQDVNISDISNNSSLNTPSTENPNTPLPGDDTKQKGYNTPKAGMSYRQVFGLQSSDYLFNVTPPNYTRHRRFSDSDTESLQNFVHRIIPQDDSKTKILQPKKWIKKVRRKSETEPKRKVIAQLSNK